MDGESFEICINGLKTPLSTMDGESFEICNLKWLKNTIVHHGWRIFWNLYISNGLKTPLSTMDGEWNL